MKYYKLKYSNNGFLATTTEVDLSKYEEITKEEFNNNSNKLDKFIPINSNNNLTKPTKNFDTIRNFIVNKEKERLSLHPEVLKRKEICEEINLYKKKLSCSDYEIIKYVEGELSEEEFNKIKELRKYYREQINKLESLLYSL